MKKYILLLEFYKTTIALKIVLFLVALLFFDKIELFFLWCVAEPIIMMIINKLSKNKIYYFYFNQHIKFYQLYLFEIILNFILIIIITSFQILINKII